MRHYQAVVNRIAEGVGRFLRKTFTRIEICGPEIDLEWMRSRRLVVACTHRSQTDYFIVGYVLFSTFGARNMRFAAGENLTELPIIGRRFREMGAFSVRRGRIFGRDYVRSLCEQVVSMLADGDSIVVFPEGGRSYGGGMMEIRGGIMGAGVLSQVRDPAHEVVFLPMAISYECLPELRYFDMLLKGKNMRHPGEGLLRRTVGSLYYYGADAIAFAKFYLASRIGMRYGAVYLDYGSPVSVGEMVNLKKDLIGQARDDFSACRLAFQKVSVKTFDLFQGLFRVLPSHVLACVLRDTGEMSPEEAAPLCVEVVQRLTSMGRNVRSVAGLSGAELVAQGVQLLAGMRGVRRAGGTIRIRNLFVVQYNAAAVD